ncbi:proprotein convertase P-domain-containing protein, partial [Pseudomonadota bacterium]
AILLIALATFSLQVWGVDCSSDNISLSTQAQVDNFQATYGGGGVCDFVNGYLNVQGNNISDLDGLANLTSVGGYLSIDSEPLTNIDGLMSLTSIGGDLWVRTNLALTDIDGLTNLSSVGGELMIAGNTFTDIDGLASLTIVGGNVLIFENNLMSNIDGLANLTSVGSSLSIYNNKVLTDIDGLASLKSVNGSLFIKSEPLTNIDGLMSLTSIGGSLDITGNIVLTNLNGLANLTSVGGYLFISYNYALTDINGLANLTNVGGGVEIRSNNALTNIDSLNKIIDLGGDLYIRHNHALGKCSALALILGWPDGPPNDNVGGVITVGDNDPGCNSIEEILASVSIPTAPRITSSDVIYGKATLSFSPATTTDTGWPITGYLATCHSEGSIFQNSTTMGIPDVSSVVSSVHVSGVPSKNAADLNITVNITHPRTRHLTITLTSPNGTSVMLWNEAAGDGENLIGTFPTTLEPAESLDAFDGEDFNGEWQLTVADGLASQTGTLNSWGITIQDKVTATSETSPITLYGLTSDIAYSCTVSAITGLGMGPESNTVSVTPIGPENPLLQMNAGLNDVWYYSVTDGQGFFINVFSDIGYVSLSWFTYDTERPPEEVTANLGDPGHRWLNALGPYSGNQAVLDISITSGGIFDTPTEVTEVNDGTIILTFSDCENGLVEYNIPSISRHGFVPIKRVVGDNIALCEAFEANTAEQQGNSKQGKGDINTTSWDVPVTVTEALPLVDMNAGLNDAWYNPVTNGQGFFITVFPEIEYISLSWFTYDTERPAEGVTANLGEPGHRWLNALGAYSGNVAVMDISITSGGLFDTATEVSEVIDGTIILTFTDCENGTVEYDIPSINQQGIVPIQRVVRDNIALCEALNSD